MLNEIIANVPADPTSREIRDAMEDVLDIGSPAELAELLQELLNAGLGWNFYDEAYNLLVKGVTLVNEREEESMLFG